ncbi:putative flavin-containing monooxygenase YUCCA3 [Clavulina sp. PMI_390]|nr:putative flavin-containing monooxygenase YUCCA3 [Clavulina sp. PMI_390]
MSEPQIDAQAIAEKVLAQLQDAFLKKDVSAIQALCLPNGYLRDLLVTSWDFASITQPDLPAFWEKHGLPEVTGLAISKKRTPPLYFEPTQWIQGLYTFETPLGYGEGFIRLLRDPQESTPSWKIFTFSLALASLKKYPEIARELRPIGTEYGSRSSTQTWLEARAEAVEFPNNDPQVVIIGAGQSGLMLAARLKRQGIRALLVEKSQRLGDTWRKRYKTLVLHDYIWGNHFPFMPFPDDWPVFIPKDKIAGWFESYASIMELNVWLESTIEPDTTVYDDATGVFTLKVRRGDGSIRELKTHHVVLATGHSGEPKIFKFKGQEDFQGVLTHSSGHKGGEGWAGKKAVVIGACNSGHDICQEFYNSGADVTMIQRSPTLVISSEPGVGVLMKPAYGEGGPPTEDADLGVASFPETATLPYQKAAHAHILDLDKDLNEGLRKAGFLLPKENTGGLLIKYHEFGGGYYINVGCSDLIIDGKVKIKSGQGVSHFEKNGIRLEDGTFLEADIVVLATGYTSMRDTARRLVGSTITDRTGEVWGYDKEGEIQGIWRRSGHPGFWYMGGNLLLARIYSHYLALQIKAIEEGIAQKI